MISILEILSVLGAFGLFLFGMKLMSESLQKITGNKLWPAASYIASSRGKTIFSGLVITFLVQSSSVVSVMAISFVNAGVIILSESIGVLLGANIGTTFKIWLIAVLGFKTETGIIALPLIGIIIPLLFSKNNVRRSWGEFALGFALLFAGTDFLKYIFGIMPDSAVLGSFLSGLTVNGIGSLMLFVIAGVVVSSLIQSSSVVIALTMVLCSNGWLTLAADAAIVLGGNIGTTITANNISRIANVQGKRTALSHTLIKISGLIWALLLFHWLIKGTEIITNGLTGYSLTSLYLTLFSEACIVGSWGI